MKSLKTIIIAAAAAMTFTACNDYLDVIPEDMRPTESMWKSKSDVESALFAGYYNLRSTITSHLIPLGELRAGCVKSRSGNDLDKFDIKPTTKTVTDWKVFYKIIADANGVIANAEKAKNNDVTYTQQELNSHLTEAYFLRALSYFYIVRNWRDAPIVLLPVETDENEIYFPQSKEEEIIAQIKKDLKTAIDLGAAKEEFDTTWETKGRATVWALYALMADVCLWSQDFDGAIKYADMILESNSPYAPRFIETATHAGWFAMFNPGNSQESIFELQYSSVKLDGTAYQTNDLPILFSDPGSTTVPAYKLSSNLTDKFNRDAQDIMVRFDAVQDMYGRTKYGSYYAAENSADGYVWKYIGGTTISEPRTAEFYDPNFIIYRVTEVMLIKAEALIMREMGANLEDNEKALEIINAIRNRTNLLDLNVGPASGLVDLLNAVIDERIMEFVAEGKAWYDLLRVGRYKDASGGVNFVNDFFIVNVINYNETAGESRVKSTLLDENAWYLPINEDEITRNKALVQNPYYE